jgi:hypothetical protein
MRGRPPMQAEGVRARMPRPTLGYASWPLLVGIMRNNLRDLPDRWSRAIPSRMVVMTLRPILIPRNNPVTDRAGAGFC